MPSDKLDFETPDQVDHDEETARDFSVKANMMTRVAVLGSVLEAIHETRNRDGGLDDLYQAIEGARKNMLENLDAF